jgi:hypothetical protein
MAVLGQTLDQEVHYDARDSMVYDLPNERVYLYGAARVTYKDLELTAARIVLDLGNEEAQAFGTSDSTGAPVGVPAFRQEGRTITADSIRYNFRTKKGLISEVRSTEDQLYALAHTSKRQESGEVHSRGGMLTTCDRPHPHYHFAVSRMMVIPGDKIVTGPALMKVGPVPTPLALPFGLFPNQQRRTAGVLVPIYGNSPALGYFFLNGGYYLPIGDRMDLQLTGDIYSRGSWGLRAQTRYRSRYRYNGSLVLSHSTLLNSRPEYPDFSRQRNFFVRWNHQVDPKASLTDRFTASVNVGTANNFTNNFNSSFTDYLSNTFQSNVQWTHQWTGKPYNLAVGLTHNQNSLQRSFSISFPTATFNVQRVFPADWFRGDRPGVKRNALDNIGLTWSSSFDNRLTTTEDQLYLDNLPVLARQMRNGIRHTGALNTSFKTRFFTVNPEVRFTDRMTFRSLRKTYFASADTVVTDTVPTFAAPFEWSAGAALTGKLYGMYTFRGGRIKAIRHVLTPTAGINYSPGNDTRVTGPFGTGGASSSYLPYDIGIYGSPSPGRSGSVNLGLVQSVEAKVLDTKASGEPGAEGPVYKKIRLLEFVGATASYNLLADSLNWSPLNISARSQLFNFLNVNLVSVWDPYATDANGLRIEEAQRAVTGDLLRLTRGNLALGFDLKSRKYGQPVGATAGSDRVVGEADPAKGADVNFNLPWRLNVNYSYDLNRVWRRDAFSDQQSQSVLFNGDLTFFRWWKLGLSSGYDLEAREWTPTSLNLYWDMHCWEFNLNVIPLGLRQSFTVRINVKASVLKDLKYELVKPFGNDRQLLR